MNLTAITDDLTGAADSGSYFTDRGRSLHIFTGEPVCWERQADEIVSVNLSSRNVAGEVARQRHFDLCRQLAKGPRQVYMKKIGTGFRGNDAYELEGMLTAMPDYTCFIIDNAPDLGTFTLYGDQYCEGEILPKSLYAKDPILPPTKSYIPEILAEHTDLKIGLVDIDAVKGGQIVEQTEARLKEGCRIVVFDAITKADTVAIISSLAPRCPNVFWTGSLGLADGLAQYLYGDPKPYPVKKRDVRCLAFCASAYDMAHRQIAYSEKNGLSVVRLDMDAVLDGDKAIQLEQTLQCALEKNKTGNVLVMPVTQRYSYKPGTSKAIMECFEALAPDLCGRAVFDRLVVVGGETAQAVFRATGTTSVALWGKPEAGVAEGLIRQGSLAGREFALKGGSVGSVYALEKMLCRFEQ